MKLKILPVVISICVTACVLAVIGFAVPHSWEADMAMSLPLELIPTEFSSDGGATWEPVGTGDALSRQHEDVAVRGHFNFDIMEGWFLNLNLQHMQMELWVNGEFVTSYAREYREIRPEWCTSIWMCFEMPEISTEDLVEFRLYSLHPAGAKMGAYEKTLSSIMLGDPFYIYQYISEQNAVEHTLGMALMIVGIVLFCLAFVALWMKNPLQRMMLYTALLTFGQGLFWLAEAAEITHYVNNSIVFFSVGRYVSQMLCIYALLAIMAEVTNGKAKFVAQAVAYINGLLCIGYLILSYVGNVTFCEAEQIWYGVEILLLLVGLGCCLWGFRHVQKSAWQIFRVLTLCLAVVAFLCDFGTLLVGWQTEMALSKWVCGMVAALQAAALLAQLPASYAAIRRAEKLSDELHNSHIVLAMSQIRTHFVFNVLNAISSLCKSDPEQADMQIVRFARYLRHNINIMQEDQPIPFETELEQMHNYVALEQLRFGDKIILDEEYEYVDFVIPSLVLQPLVENAIKHGLLPKAEGGVIQVNTTRCNDEVLISITDNGVGFDTSKDINKASVGLSNVRFRVEKMMNGRMQIKSTPGAGTVVRLWLPLGKEEFPSI